MVPLSDPHFCSIAMLCKKEQECRPPGTGLRTTDNNGITGEKRQGQSTFNQKVWKKVLLYFLHRHDNSQATFHWGLERSIGAAQGLF